ncbi:protein-L-isoaspartate(D-aspartate) O-methyltransferase [Candidatus Albibeggiatoa sp. nov. NOAA]|uniref:protein-L-isoaspartate(D-aspartate) O-methyltransferase n=1 Tax=Candidatus Albibeggiatoa sp. nov. NOAA TaxID=3162724 RepID=UPI0033040F59|nr:protein-L-isoaspartate(D-aspartate) O-methyltransferase [Thiotrichaceae bacterium]
MNYAKVTKTQLLSQYKYERQQLIERLQQKGIETPEILDIIYKVPRHFFVDEALSSHAYADHPLPIGHSQTISQPFIVAKMTELLWHNAPHGKVLEIGTGCGYQTAVLAHLFDQVYSVERIASLAGKAYERLKFLEFTNIAFSHSDGFDGWPDNAPYQAIIVTAAPESLPPNLLGQLDVNGCLIIPVGHTGQQQLLKIIRKPNCYEQHVLDPVSFVPLKEGII